MAENYQGNRLPVGMGIIIIAGAGLSLLSTLPFYWLQWEREGLAFLFLLTAIGLLGLMDDAAGCKGVRGLRGHLSCFFQEGYLSTGLLKAAGGVASSFFVSWLWADSMGLLLLDGLLLSLSINTLNLFDLRPGRAVKIFLLLMLMTYFGGGRGAGPFFLCAAVIGAVLAYLPIDIQGKAMLGDTGANVLGAVVGAAFTWSLSPGRKIIAVMSLCGLHILSERYSFSKAFEGIPMLRFFDRLGRPEA